jgi:hypothetical protein
VRYSCPGNCLNNGICNDDTGICSCKPMFTGSSCNIGVLHSVTFFSLILMQNSVVIKGLEEHYS